MTNDLLDSAHTAADYLVTGQAGFMLLLLKSDIRFATPHFESAFNNTVGWNKARALIDPALSHFTKTRSGIVTVGTYHGPNAHSLADSYAQAVVAKLITAIHHELTMQGHPEAFAWFSFRNKDSVPTQLTSAILKLVWPSIQATFNAFEEIDYDLLAAEMRWELDHAKLNLPISDSPNPRVDATRRRRISESELLKRNKIWELWNQAVTQQIPLEQRFTWLLQNDSKLLAGLKDKQLTSKINSHKTWLQDEKNVRFLQILLKKNSKQK